MSNHNVDIVRTGYGDFAKGNIPGVLASFDSRIDWTEPKGFPYGGHYVGPNEVKEKLLSRLGTEWEGYRVEPKEYIDSGEKVVVLGEYSGKYKATGKSFHADFVHVWTIHDGKAVKFAGFTDTALAQNAVKK